MSAPWVTAISIPHLVRAVTLVGRDPAPLVARFALPADPRFEDRMPIATVCDLWEAALELTGRRDLGVIAGANVINNERSLIGFAASNQLTLGACVERMDRYYPTVSSGYKWRKVVDDEWLRIELSPTGPVQRLGWQTYLEFEAIDIMRNGAQITGGKARPVVVRYLHAAPEIAPVLVAAHGVQVEYSAPACELVFPRSVIDLPVPDARPEISRRIEEELDTMLEQLARGTDVSARARRVLGPLMREGSGDVAAVARALGMSRRSLERALADEGTSVGALLQEERMQCALAWLPTLSVDEVAQRLGYSDARAFARAFRRWTGRAPSELRRR